MTHVYKKKEKVLDPGHVLEPNGTTAEGKRRMTCACGVSSTMEPEIKERCRLLPKEEHHESAQR